MKFSQSTSETFVPDGTQAQLALSRTTHLGIGAHQDDLEVMCLSGILTCYGDATNWFTGVVVTNGAGSARDNIYADYTDSEMMIVRRHEQKKAAYVGDYSAQVFMEHPSSVVKDPSNHAAEDDILNLLLATNPKVVYLHNLADKHATHIGVAMNSIRALRRLPTEKRPGKVYGCEVWRNLDWMMDDQKVVFPISNHENLAHALIGVFDSQIVGGKRYDLAIMGRRRANATFFQSHSVDSANLIDFAMDLTPLIEDDAVDVEEFALDHIAKFANDVRSNLARFKA